jgi:pSer/pThr/pTyr-binding forkhead associated (FHA) protein
MTTPPVGQPASVSGPETSALTIPGSGGEPEGSPRSGDTLSGDTVALRAITFTEPGEAAPVRLSSSAQAAIAALPPGSALLIVHQGAGVGARFLLDAETVTAGRHPKRDILLDDATVSRNHAEFHREGTGYAVRDTGSLNGLYLNTTRIDAAVLQAGDEIQIGKFRLVYHPSPNRPSSPAAQPHGTSTAPVPSTTAAAVPVTGGGNAAPADVPARVPFLKRWFSRRSSRA